MGELAKLLEFLATPFPAEEVDFKVQTFSKDRKKGMVVPYVDARTVQNRLDEAVREGLIRDWEPTFRILEQRTSESGSYYAVECVLTLRGAEAEYRRADVGEGDSLKGAYSDALKRAAVHFGIARYLYESTKEWVELKEGGFIPEEAIKRLRGKLAAGRKPEAKAAPAKSSGKEDELKTRIAKADEHLEKLIAELKEKGLGAEATRLVAASGYKIGESLDGKSVQDLEALLEKARALYASLQALVK